MAMVAILFNDAEPFEQIDNTPFDRRPSVNSGEKWSSCFREEDVLRLQEFIYLYSPGARADNSSR